MVDSPNRGLFKAIPNPRIWLVLAESKHDMPTGAVLPWLIRMLSKPTTLLSFGLFSSTVINSLLQLWPANALTKSDDIDTNRPSFTSSPLVVLRGSWQLENGGLYQHFQHGINYFDASETQVRFGLAKRTEFQMFGPSWVLLHTRGSGIASPTTARANISSIETDGETQTGVSD